MPLFSITNLLILSDTIFLTTPLAFSLLSGLLLNLIFPEWGIDALAWVALVPLFWALIKSPSPKNSFFLGLCSGLIYFTGSCFWITNTMVHYGHLPFGVSIFLLFLLTFYMALYPAIFSAVFFIFKKRKGIFWALIFSPFLWSFLEFCRSFLFTGFPWNFLGYSQYQNLHIIQIADITGIYGVSFFICLINAFLCFCIGHLLDRENLTSGTTFKGRDFRVFATITLITIIIVFSYGNIRLSDYTEANKEDLFRVSLVQGNIDQEKKWNPLYKDKILEIYKNLTLGSIKKNTDLVVWPETAIPFFFNFEISKTENLKNFTKEAGIYLLTGSPSLQRDEDKNLLSNSAYLISDKGLAIGRYDKVKLVPFGEYVPLKNLLWFVGKMVVGIGNFFPGEEPKIMPHPRSPFGVLICFEIIFPDLARWNVQKGARFLVNITNDAWFGKSAGPYQHLSKVVFRAIENRVPIVRAANTGISAFINQKGQVEAATEIFVRKTIEGEISPAKGTISFYTKFGDLFVYLCGAVIFCSLAFCLSPTQKNFPDDT